MGDMRSVFGAPGEGVLGHGSPQSQPRCPEPGLSPSSGVPESGCDGEGEASGAAPGLGRAAPGPALLLSLWHLESPGQISLEERLLPAVVVETDLTLQLGQRSACTGFPAYWPCSLKVTSAS